MGIRADEDAVAHAIVYNAVSNVGKEMRQPFRVQT